jgi:hypothetical protein
MYPSTSLFIAIGQFVVVILVLFSYPLQVHPCRNCLDKVFFSHRNAYKPLPVTQTDGPDTEVDATDSDHGNSDMSPGRHTSLTTTIVASSFTIAYFVSDLKLGKWLPYILLADAKISNSAVLRWVHRIHNYFFHPPRAILLAGEELSFVYRTSILTCSAITR